MDTVQCASIHSDHASICTLYLSFRGVCITHNAHDPLFRKARGGPTRTPRATRPCDARGGLRRGGRYSGGVDLSFVALGMRGLTGWPHGLLPAVGKQRLCSVSVDMRRDALF